MSKIENLVKTEFMGCVFYLNAEKAGKLEKDLDRVKAIFAKGLENITFADRLELLSIYKAAYHESGKIEGVTSYDSTATNCAFCKAIRAANETNDLCICNGCYDMAQEAYRIDVLNRHTLNMLIMMSVEFTIDELRMLPATAIDRVNSSGDTPNEIYARNMLKLCFAFPHAHFAYWAKNTTPVVAACQALGKPSNLIMVQSSCMIGVPAKKAPFFDYVFTVYPDKETCEMAIVEGASACNGKKCRDCGYKCYFGTHESDNIAEVLRGASKEKVQALREMLVRMRRL